MNTDTMTTSGKYICSRNDKKQPCKIRVQMQFTQEMSAGKVWGFVLLLFKKTAVLLAKDIRRIYFNVEKKVEHTFCKS